MWLISLQIKRIDMQLLVDFNNLCIIDSVDDPSWNPKLLGVKDGN
jgi:hypothetical protein